jgi:4-amino-4-deoxy-L-arabinose transferase-like glycosyltransferase
VKSAILLVALAAALVLTCRHDLGAPFGPTHDGRNAAQWALASDGVDARGLFGSRLGAIHADGSVYANHPPLTGLVTAASVAALGRDETAVRLPGLLAALATIPLLWLVLARLGFPRHAATVGCVIALATPMFFGYGSMVDSPPLSFPIGLALVAAWRSPARREWLLGALAALAVLAGWQAGLLVALLVAVELAGAVRRRQAPSWGLPSGLAGGVVLLGSWLLWVHGSMGPVLDQLVYRSGNGDHPIGVADSIRTQASTLRLELGLPVLVVAAAGCCFAVREARTRAVTGAAVLVVGAYALTLRQAAFWHAYWNYWALLPVAIGLAMVASLLLAVPTESRLARSGARFGVTAVAIVAIAVAATSPAPAKVEARDAYDAAAPLRGATFPASQHRLWLIGHVEAPASWVEFYARRPISQIRSVASLDRVRRAHPDDLVFIAPSCFDGAVCRAADEPGGGARYRLEPLRKVGQAEARG